MKITNRSGISATYPNEEVDRVSFCKAGEVLNTDDLAGNQISADAVIMVISMKDGGTATFEALNWSIEEL